MVGTTGTKRGRGAWKNDLSAAKLAGNFYGVEPGRAAPSEQHAVFRVVTLIDGNFLDGLDHVLAGERHDAGCGLLNADIERRREPSDGNSCRRGIELEPPSQK